MIFKKFSTLKDKKINFVTLQWVKKPVLVEKIVNKWEVILAVIYVPGFFVLDLDTYGTGIQPYF